MGFIAPFTNVSEGLRILLLIALIILGAALSIGVAFGLYAIIYGPASLMQPEAASSIGFLRIMQICNQIGMFVLPPLTLAVLTEKHPVKFLGLRKTNGIYFLIALLLSVSVGPIVGILMELNEAMNLPDNLRYLEDWMRKMENSSTEITERILSYNDGISISINIVMIIILPSVGEELLFRAALIPSFTKVFKSQHIAVFISAILFSAMHLQFYGFLPRFVLGLLFGYLFIYSRSVWVPIFAHLLNNGTIVLITYLNQFGYITQNPDELGHVDSLWLILISILLSGTLLWSLAKIPKPEI